LVFLRNPSYVVQTLKLKARRLGCMLRKDRAEQARLRVRDWNEAPGRA